MSGNLPFIRSDDILGNVICARIDKLLPRPFPEKSFFRCAALEKKLRSGRDVKRM